MAKKKVSDNKPTMTEEEIEDKEIRLLSEPKSVHDLIAHVPEPTYFFKEGDFVRYGAMRSSVVKKVLENGKAYILKCLHVRNRYGVEVETTSYALVSWLNVRPVEIGETSFAQESDLFLSFYQSTVESLLHKAYYFGIDMDPEYQRGYDWSDEDREYLIDSIFENLDIGKFVLVKLSSDEWAKRGVSFEILDGKQRLNTLKLFYENRLKYKGKFYNELSPSDMRAFKEHPITCAEVHCDSKREIYQYFLRLNRCGRQMDKAHLAHIQECLDSLENDKTEQITKG